MTWDSFGDMKFDGTCLETKFRLSVAEGRMADMSELVLGPVEEQSDVAVLEGLDRWQTEHRNAIADGDTGRIGASRAAVEAFQHEARKRGLR